MPTKKTKAEGNFMTAKEKARKDKRDKPAWKLPVPLAARLSDCAVRFLLGAVLSGAEIQGGHALFGLALVGVCRPGGEGLAALLGAALGYLSFRGFVGGLRYIAASMMVYAVALALGEFQIYRRRWFMPLTCAALNGLVGFVYQSAAGWDGPAIAGFVAEVALTAGAVYFYRLAFQLWEAHRPGEKLTTQQLAGALVLGATLLMTLERVEVADSYSLGRVLCVLAVLIAAWKGGVGIGSAAGVAAGLAMDLAGGVPPYHTITYALPGLVTGLFAGQSRLLCALAYLLAGGSAALWTWSDPAGTAQLWEIAAGCALFPLLPDRLLRRLSALARQEEPEGENDRARQLAVRHLRSAATAFRAVSGGLRGAFQAQPAVNDADAARLFDRAAERVCAKCRQRERCWQKEYQSTRTALGDALNPMLDRGEGLREDFPSYFAGRCVQFDAFLGQANRELTTLLQRRRYDSRVRESRAAVCAQYGQLAQVLDQAAMEAAREPAVDVRRQRLVKQRMAALGLEGRCTVYEDEYGHLRLEVEGPGVEKLTQAGEVSRLSALLGCPMRAEEKGERGRACLSQREPLVAVAGVAAADREGQAVSGDTGAWFKDESGKLNVILCDGMGSGAAARGDSDCALRLLEKFLRAGLTPEGALKTVGEALALRGEEQGGFTTVDLLQVDLYSGKSAIYKFGAAPTYLRRGGEVERLEGSSLPAGLSTGEPDLFPLTLDAGDCVVLVSDGVATGKDDGWLRQALADFDGLSPQELAGRILQESGARMGAGDDRTVMVLKLDVRK